MYVVFVFDNIKSYLTQTLKENIMFISMKTQGIRLSPLEKVFERQRSREVIVIMKRILDKAFEKEVKTEDDLAKLEQLQEIALDLIAHHKELFERDANDAEVQELEKRF